MQGNHFMVRVPEGYVFLDASQTRHLLEDVWGNLPDEDVLGAVVPDSSRLFVQLDVAFLLYYDDCGYVKDEDAEEIDYDDLLKEVVSDLEGNIRGGIQMNSEMKQIDYEGLMDKVTEVENTEITYIVSDVLGLGSVNANSS